MTTTRCKIYWHLATIGGLILGGLMGLYGLNSTLESRVTACEVQEAVTGAQYEEILRRLARIESRLEARR